MKYICYILSIVLLFSCSYKAISTELKFGIIYVNGDIIAVHVDDESIAWKVVKVQRGALILETLHQGHIIGNGILDLNGDFAMYSYSRRINKEIKKEFIYFKYKIVY